MDLKRLIIALLCCLVSVQCRDDACFFPVQEGVCRALIPSFYFNQQTGVCDCFPFGGCGAGPNHFSTIEQCMQVCQVDSRDQYFSESCERLFGIPATQPINVQIQPSLPPSQSFPSVSQPIQEQQVPVQQQFVPQPSVPPAQQEMSAQFTPDILAELQRVVSSLTPAQIIELERQIQIIRQRNEAQNTIQSEPSQQPIEFQNEINSARRVTPQQPRPTEPTTSQPPSRLQNSRPRPATQSVTPSSFSVASSKEDQGSGGFAGVPLSDTRPSVISLQPISSTVFTGRGMTSGEIRLGQPVQISP